MVIKNIFDHSKDTILRVIDNTNRYIIIEGSNDSSDWTTINERNNDSSLTNYSASNTFDIKQNNNFYRYIRIKEIISQDNGHQLLLSEIEFFGSIMNI